MKSLNEEQSQAVVDFVAWGVAMHAYSEAETIYRTNLVLAKLGATSLVQGLTGHTDTNLSDLADQLIAVQDTDFEMGWQAAIDRTELLNIVTPTPDVLAAEFERLYKVDPEQAVKYYYFISESVENVKVKDIARNIAFTHNSKYGDIEITINLSKPEKTTAEIKAAASAPKSTYPPTALDYTNEGYLGTVTAAPRLTHRFIRENFSNETWGWHYSPYAYFEEHAIFVNFKRQPMQMGLRTFTRLMQIVTRYPMYMVGSNADLPIVGGSILSQEHYQAGRHAFPMMKADVKQKVALSEYENVEVAVLNWPMTAFRVSSTDAADVVAASEFIRRAWEKYSDEKLMIHATSAEGDRQHTVTPIAQFKDGKYELYLVLRDNGTSEDYPMGIFHPHADVQHIKQENIGLIEVMGLAILPARLLKELQKVEDFLIDRASLDEVAEGHRAWAQQIKQDRQASPTTVTEIVQEEVGKVFVRVLEDAGVYKDDANGQAGLDRFIKYLASAE